MLARNIAIIAHGDQKYGDQPYVFHLDWVVDVLRRFKIKDKTVISAAYLHDVLEDTPLTKASLEAWVGWEVTHRVALVTDPKEGNRRERKEAVINRLCRDGSESGIEATAIKIADRIANVEHCLLTGSKHFYMYKEEQEEFARLFYVVKYWTKGNYMAEYLTRLFRNYEQFRVSK